MLMMRIRDANGPWKACEEDPRLLVARDPAEAGGQYYRLLPEGRIEDYDGTTIRVQPYKEGLDLNRNYPVNWRQGGTRTGRPVDFDMERKSTGVARTAAIARRGACCSWN
jgi:murein tripeptide amidase MpaA